MTLIITPQDCYYPDTWAILPQDIAPTRLFARGNPFVLYSHSVAIVGTREPTELGKDSAYRIAAYFAARDYTIISGLCGGIDTAAHEGALSVKGKTIAVLPHALGHSVFYERENIGLAERIVDSGGLLITEYEAGRAHRDTFLARNRLIAGHALATIPVQMTFDRQNPDKSGTANAVGWTKRFHRLVWLPQPRAQEAQHPAYEGIWNQMLMMSITRGFTKQDYDQLVGQLEEKQAEVLQRWRSLSTI